MYKKIKTFKFEILINDSIPKKFVFDNFYFDIN
jgi:hypothetical protein